MARGITTSGTTGTVTASGGTLAVHITGLPNFFLITKVKIQPSGGSGPFNVEVFKKDTLGGADLMAKWQSVNGNIYEPADYSGGTPAEGNAALGICWYEDADSTGELHLKFTNNDSSNRTYSYSITYEESLIFDSNHHVTLEGVTSTGATGTGKFVFDNSPIFITPALGTPASGNLTNCTGFPVAQLAGLGSNVAAFLATPSSANLRSAVTDETGTGPLVFGDNPVLVGPALGTPASGNLTNCTGYQIGNLSGSVTGSGALVFSNTPTLITPNIGAATGTSLVVSGGITGDVLTATGGILRLGSAVDGSGAVWRHDSGGLEARTASNGARTGIGVQDIDADGDVTVDGFVAAGSLFQSGAGFTQFSLEYLDHSSNQQTVTVWIPF